MSFLPAPPYLQALTIALPTHRHPCDHHPCTHLHLQLGSRNGSLPTAVPPLQASLILQAFWAPELPVGLGGGGKGPSSNCLHLIFYFTHIFSD